MLPLISTMSTPAAMTIETAPAVIWAMIALFAVASAGILKAAWVARNRAHRDAAERELMVRLARRVALAADSANPRLAA